MYPAVESFCLQARAVVRQTCTRPGVRQTVKMVLDAALAGVGWVAAFSLVRIELPHALSTILWVAFAPHSASL